MRKTISVTCYVIALILVIIGIVFCSKGFNKKNSYDYDNMYVGGDAYNYIINAGYFTGYLALATGMFVSASIFISVGIKSSEDEDILSELQEMNYYQKQAINRNQQPNEPVVHNTSSSKPNISRIANDKGDGTWYCSDCGTTNASNSRTCKGCGKSVDKQGNLEEAEKSVMSEDSVPLSLDDLVSH